ncbi:hypothetical protein BN1723_020613, partial [Verticillium longisporum]
TNGFCPRLLSLFSSTTWTGPTSATLASLALRRTLASSITSLATSSPYSSSPTSSPRCFGSRLSSVSAPTMSSLSPCSGGASPLLPRALCR